MPNSKDLLMLASNAVVLNLFERAAHLDVEKMVLFLDIY
jgi:hypothetical protein